MKTLVNLIALVLACGCTTAYADGPRFRLFRVTRTVPVQSAPVPMANPAVCTCGPVCPCVQSTPVEQYTVVSSTPVYTALSSPVASFFDERPVANAVVNTVQAPFLFFQENQPVRTVLKSIPSLPVCKDGKCNLK